MDTKGKVETNTQTSTVKKRPRSSKGASPKTSKPARPASRSSNVQSGKLVCRYCGSDDLAPSFRKRRDARCRACFKSRYGSSARSNKAKKATKEKAKK
jgi:hypothetical protein